MHERSSLSKIDWNIRTSPTQDWLRQKWISYGTICPSYIYAMPFITKFAKEKFEARTDACLRLKEKATRNVKEVYFYHKSMLSEHAPLSSQRMWQRRTLIKRNGWRKLFADCLRSQVRWQWQCPWRWQPWAGCPPSTQDILLNFLTP